MEEENFWITRKTSSFEWAAFPYFHYLITLPLSYWINVGNLTNRSQNSVVDVMIISQAGGAKNCLRLPAWSRGFYSSKRSHRLWDPDNFLRNCCLCSFLVVKRLEDEVGQSPPYFSKVTVCGAIPPLSHMTSSKPLPLLHRLENKQFITIM